MRSLDTATLSISVGVLERYLIKNMGCFIHMALQKCRWVHWGQLEAFMGQEGPGRMPRISEWKRKW
jgi:hypothetical protein